MGCEKTLASKLRHKITIQVKTAARGATGAVTDTWSTHLIVRASVEPLIGREYFQAMQEQSENKVKFRVRYSAAIGALNVRDHRISFKSNTYDIESIINVFEQNKEVVIMAVLHNE